MGLNEDRFLFMETSISAVHNQHPCVDNSPIPVDNPTSLWITQHSINAVTIARALLCPLTNQPGSATDDFLCNTDTLAWVIHKDITEVLPGIVSQVGQATTRRTLFTYVLNHPHIHGPYYYY